MTRRADIQGLRALAVLMVIAYHAGFPIPGGFTGVDIFFAISGFVITGTLLRELASTGRISLSKFYIRRIKRLLPALAVVLAFVAVAGSVANPLSSQRMAALTGISASGFSANIYLGHLPTGYFDVSATLNPLLHTWTLAVEEQFYVVFPTLLAAVWWLGRSRRVQGRSRAISIAVIGAISFASFLLSFALSRGSLIGVSGSHEKLAFYASPTRAWEFGLGALVVLTTPRLTRLPAWTSHVLGVAGLGAVGFAAFSHLDAMHQPETSVLLPVIGACFLLAAGIPAQSGLSRLLGLRPFAWIGDLSYSLYLWHWPMIVFAKAVYPYSEKKTAAIAAALSFVPAWLSYRYVENPIRYHTRLGSRSLVAGRTALAVAAVCVAVPVVANFGLLKAQAAIGATARMEAWRDSGERHADSTRGCSSLVPLAERMEDTCTWKASRPRGEVVLFGDSQAGQFTEPVVRAGNDEGYDVTVITASSCPYLGLRLTGTGGEVVGCPRWGTKTLEALLRRKPSLVILATRIDSYVQNPNDGLSPAGVDAFVYETESKVRLWRRTLGSMLLRLNEAGVPVVLIHPIPIVPLPPGDCAVGRILLGKCGAELPRGDVDAWLGNMIRLEDEIVAPFPSTWALDLQDRICHKDGCSTVRNGIVQYRDSQHLSVTGALMLTEDFERVIVARAIPLQN